MRAKRLLLVLTVVVCLPLAAQQHPVRERGFRPEYVYDPNGFDTINVTTGNLIGTIPLGTTYPVGEGLSYGFTLYYTGNLWEDWEDCSLIDPYAPCTTRYYKRVGDNAGFGWRISFGRLHEGVTTDPEEYNSAAAKWRYEAPDGSEHLFWETAHEPQCVGGTTTECDPVVNGFLYTRDNSYLRLRSIGTSVRVVEFPDGRRHRFALTVGKGWRITHMYTAASTASPTTGLPSDNYVAFSYVPGAVAGVDDLVVTDSHAREHRVSMAGTDRIDKVELAVFRTDNQLYANQKVTATYTLHYKTGQITRPCNESADPTGKELVYTLDRLATELGENWALTRTRTDSSRR